MSRKTKNLSTVSINHFIDMIATVFIRLQISDMTTHIASATEEKLMVAEEINRNIIQISNYAKETIEGSEETTKCSQDMQGLAENLNSIVKQFVV